MKTLLIGLVLYLLVSVLTCLLIIPVLKYANKNRNIDK